MKYMLFLYFEDKPKVGWNDFQGFTDKIERAEEQFKRLSKRGKCRGQIINATSLQVEKEL